MRRLDAHPRGSELDLVGAAAERAFDGQPARLQDDAFAVAGVARIDEQRGADREQLDARRTA